MRRHSVAAEGDGHLTDGPRDDDCDALGRSTLAIADAALL